MSLVVTGAVTETHRDRRTAHWWFRLEAHVLIPLEAKRVDDVQPKLGWALDVVAVDRGVKITHAKTPTAIVELGTQFVSLGVVQAGVLRCRDADSI